MFIIIHDFTVMISYEGLELSMRSIKMTSQHELLDFPGCNIMLSVKIHGYNIAFFVTKPPSWVKKAY